MTSSRCAGSALTDGIAMNSLSSLRNVSSTRRDSTQVVRAAAEASRLVIRVQQAAGLQRQAPAADAGREARADGLERRDALVELASPARGETRPVLLRGLAALGQHV